VVSGQIRRDCLQAISLGFILDRWQEFAQGVIDRSNDRVDHLDLRLVPIDDTKQIVWMLGETLGVKADRNT
jgi:hypothetical protein